MGGEDGGEANGLVKLMYSDTSLQIDSLIQIWALEWIRNIIVIDCWFMIIIPTRDKIIYSDLMG